MEDFEDQTIYFEKMKKKNTPYFFAVVIFLIISFFQHNEHIHKEIQGLHSSRQTQTMWNIRNFVRHDRNILNPRVNTFNGGRENLYRLEFPIMQWSIAQVERVFGEKIEIVRVLIFLIGIGSVFGIFFLIYYIVGNWFSALIGSVLFQYSPIFYYYTINPIPDNLALCGGIWYLYFIVNYYKTKKLKHLILGSIFLLISVLAKLPFIMYSAVTIYFFFVEIRNEKRLSLSNLKSSFLQLLFLSPAIAWYLWVIPTWSTNPVLSNTIISDNFIFEEYWNLICFHATEMFPNVLLSKPIWVLFILGLWAMSSKKFLTGWIYSLIFITFLYLIVELKPIGIVHDYYMIPFLPWLFLVIALGAETVRNLNPKFKFVLIAICMVSAIYTQRKTDELWSIEKSYFNKDVLLYSEELKNIIPNDKLCIILNDPTGYVFSYRIDKMGYIFRDNNLPMPWIDDMVRNHSVQYMYSDSEKINNDLELFKFIDKIILEKGSVKVFKLKVPEVE